MSWTTVLIRRFPGDSLMNELLFIHIFTVNVQHEALNSSKVRVLRHLRIINFLLNLYWLFLTQNIIPIESAILLRRLLHSSVQCFELHTCWIFYTIRNIERVYDLTLLLLHTDMPSQNSKFTTWYRNSRRIHRDPHRWSFTREGPESSFRGRKITELVSGNLPLWTFVTFK